MISRLKPPDLLARLRLLGQNEYKITAVGRDLRFDISDVRSRRWFGTRCRDGLHEPEVGRLFGRACDANATIFDIGSHLGLYAVLASVCGAEDVHAFDLDQRRLGIIGKHPSLNNTASLVLGPVGEASGQTVSYAPRMKDSPSTARIVPVSINEGASQEVSTISLDDYCRWRGITPDIVKIDVEGAEASVLRGFESTLATSPPDHLFIEVHPNYLQTSGESPEVIQEIVQQHGYNCDQIPGDGTRLHASR